MHYIFCVKLMEQLIKTVCTFSHFEKRGKRHYTNNKEKLIQKTQERGFSWEFSVGE